MPNELLLDSTVLVDHLRRRVHIHHLVRSLDGAPLAWISVISRAEIMAGMRPGDELVTLALLRSFTSIPVSAAIADRAGRWVSQYRKQGVSLALPDALIAATAVEHDLLLLTGNAKHFPMPELRLQTWPNLAAGGPAPAPLR